MAQGRVAHLVRRGEPRVGASGNPSPRRPRPAQAGRRSVPGPVGLATRNPGQPAVVRGAVATRPRAARPGTAAWLPAFALIVGVAVFGWRTLRDRTPAGWRRGLATAAVVGLVLAAAPSLPWTNTLMRSMAVHVRGAGFLRDSQKFVIPWLALAAVAFGCGVDRIAERLPAVGPRWRGRCWPWCRSPWRRRWRSAPGGACTTPSTHGPGTSWRRSRRPTTRRARSSCSRGTRTGRSPGTTLSSSTNRPAVFRAAGGRRHGPRGVGVSAPRRGLLVAPPRPPGDGRPAARPTPCRSGDPLRRGLRGPRLRARREGHVRAHAGPGVPRPPPVPGAGRRADPTVRRDAGRARGGDLLAVGVVAAAIGVLVVAAVRPRRPDRRGSDGDGGVAREPPDMLARNRDPGGGRT